MGAYFRFPSFALFDIRDGMSVKYWNNKIQMQRKSPSIYSEIVTCSASNSRESIISFMLYSGIHRQPLQVHNYEKYECCWGIHRIIFHYLNSLKSSHCMNLMRNTCLAHAFQHELRRKSTQNVSFLSGFWFTTVASMNLTHLRYDTIDKKLSIVWFGHDSTCNHVNWLVSIRSGLEREQKTDVDIEFEWS